MPFPEFPDPLPLHLAVTKSDRGFARLPSIPSSYGGQADVYESSVASRPHIWMNVTSPVDLNDPTGEMKEATMHFTVEDAWRLSQQLQFLVINHYHGDSAWGRIMGAGLEKEDAW